MKTRFIYCIDCGAKREIHTNNYKQVKRCMSCQYKMKRTYNNAYVKRRRMLKK